jgi:caa(3)-type oxidase subunit IV
MHVRHSTRLTRLVIAGGLLWFLILIGMTYTDFGSRTWMGVPGR